MSSAFTADTRTQKTRENGWEAEQQTAGTALVPAVCRTSAFLELVGIAIDIRVGMHIPVVTQLWIKVTSNAAAQIEQFH